MHRGDGDASGTRREAQIVFAKADEALRVVRHPIEFVGEIGQAVRRMFVGDLSQHHGQFVRQRQIARGLIDIGALIQVLRDREDQLIDRQLACSLPASGE